MITDQALQFHPLSWADTVGRLFWNEGHLYRGIRGERADLYRSLLQSGTLRDLLERKWLIDSDLTHESTAEFPLIMQHRRLPVVSYPSEWCGSQFKAAALLILDLELALRPKGLTLEDAGPWNVLFDGFQPVYVDFSSIAPLCDARRWPSRRVFHEFYLYPLQLFEAGLGRVARRLLSDGWHGVSEEEIQGLRQFGGQPVSSRQAARHRVKAIGQRVIPPVARPIVKRTLRSLRDAVGSPRQSVEPTDATSEIVTLRDRVTAMNVSGPLTAWAGYYDKNFPSFAPSQDWTKKHHSIDETLERLRPRSLLDFAANRGWYSRLAALKGVRVLAADTDETALNALYGATVEATEGNLWTVFMDARAPEPSQGPAYEVFEPASERFRSEMVLALAIVHHLVFTAHLTFDQIVRNLMMFTERWLVIEFVRPDDPAVRRFPNLAQKPWYTEENFRSALSKYFEILEVLPSDGWDLAEVGYGHDERRILVCERRK